MKVVYKSFIMKRNPPNDRLLEKHDFVSIDT